MFVCSQSTCKVVDAARCWVTFWLLSHRQGKPATVLLSSAVKSAHQICVSCLLHVALYSLQVACHPLDMSHAVIQCLCMLHGYLAVCGVSWELRRLFAGCCHDYGLVCGALVLASTSEWIYQEITPNIAMYRWMRRAVNQGLRGNNQTSSNQNTNGAERISASNLQYRQHK